MMEFTEQNKATIKNIRNYSIILVFCFLVLTIQECSHRKEKIKLIQDISNYSDSAKTYIDKHNNLVSYNKYLEFENEKTLKAYISSNETMKDLLNSYKSIKSVTTITQNAIIRHDTIPFETKIPCSFKPFQIKRDSIYYKFIGTIYQDRFSIDSMIIPNKQSIVIGTKKVGFLKRENRIEIINSNPLITTTNIGSYVIDDKKKWFQKPLVTFGIGALIGITTNLVIQHTH